MDVYEVALGHLCDRVGNEITEQEYDEAKKASTNTGDPLILTIACPTAVGKRREIFDRLLSGFQRFVQPLHRFSSAIDTLSQASSTSIVVWGPVKFALVVADDVQENNDLVLEKLQWVADCLPAIHQYRAAISSQIDNALRIPLVKIIVEFLTFCILARRYLRTGPARVVFDAASTRAGFDRCLKVVKEQSGILQNISVSQIYALMYEMEKARGWQGDASGIPTKDDSSEGKTHVPQLLSSEFVGREQELKQLKAALSLSMISHGRGRAAIFGMTGVGKSQLMLKFEEAYRHDYASTFWITAGSQEKLMVSIQKMLDILGVPERTRPEHHVKLNAFQTWLKRSQRWLVMFDNVTEEEYYMIKEIIPSTANGDMLFTSQLPGAMEALVGGLESCLELNLLSEDVAVDFILSRSTGYPAKAKSHDPAVRRCAEEIVQVLGSLPLALDTAASHVRETRLDLFTFLQNLRSESGKERFFSWTNDFAFDPDRPTLSKTFYMSLKALERRHPRAMDVLRLLSLFEPENIPPLHLQISTRSQSFDLQSGSKQIQSAKVKVLVRNLLCVVRPNSTNNVPEHQPNFSRVELEEALAKLVKYSMIRRLPEKGAIWMHDLTRHHARHLISPNERGRWLCVALDSLYHTFPMYDNTDDQRSLVDLFLPQAETIINQSQKENLPVEKYAKLIVICGLCHHNRGAYGTALRYFDSARPAFRTYLGESHGQFLNLQHRIGWSYREIGKLKQCEQYHRHTIEMRKRHHGPNADETLDAISDLAFTIERQGKLKEGEAMFKTCYEGQKIARGLGHSRTLAAAHNLALCFANQGRLEEAETLYRLTIEESDRQGINRNEHGRLKTLSCLAITLDHQGRLDEAKSLNEQALEGYEKHFGKSHLLTLRVQSNLSGLLRVQGRFGEAEKIIRTVIPNFLRVLGPDHFHVAIAHYDLGEILHEAGSFDTGKEFYSLSIAVMESEGGAPDHPLLLRTFDALGILYREIGELASSENLATTAYRRNESLLGWFDPYTLVAANNYAEVLQARGLIGQAKALYEKSFTSVRKLLGIGHPHECMILNNLGRLAWAESDAHHLERAFDFFQTAYRSLTGRLGSTHGLTLVVQANIARTMLMQAKYGEAEELLLEVRAGIVTFYGSRHPQVAAVDYALGVTALAQNFHEKARKHLDAAVSVWQRVFHTKHPDLLRAIAMLIRTLRASDEVDEALSQENYVQHSIQKGPPEDAMAKERTQLYFDPFVSNDSPFTAIAHISPIAYGSTIRYRWGRKSCWRELYENVLNI